jgi:hypothetical protein
MGSGAATLGQLPGLHYIRLLGLRSKASAALRRGKRDLAAKLARELLSLAERYRTDWYYGNAVHHGHLILGHVALASHDFSSAGLELLAAGRTPGSPQLNSFGPNMELALDLLRAGDRETVLEYFALCRRFWQLGQQKLDWWASEVAAEREPAFGSNLFY